MPNLNVSFRPGISNLKTKSFLVDRAGNFPRVKALGAILGSLGETNFQTPDAIEGTECLPFALSPRGARFFKELFNLNGINTNAYLLMFPDYAKYRVWGEFDDLSRGMRSFPYGLLFQFGDVNSKAACFFDLGPLVLGTSFADVFQAKTKIPDIIDVCFPGTGYRPLHIKIESQQLSVSDDLLMEQLYEDCGFDGEVSSLKIYQHVNGAKHSPLFSSQDLNSEDFRKGLCASAKFIKGKRFQELGCGEGANLLYALKMGASSVRATDISFGAALFSYWNIVFAQESGQISPVSDGQVEIVCKDGFWEEPADFYAINMPLIVTDGINLLHEGEGSYISEKNFYRLFEELKRKVNRKNVFALLRVMPGLAPRDSLYFPEPKEETLKGYGWFAESHRASIISEARGKDFLWSHGFEPRKPTRYYSVFLLSGKES